MEATDPKARFSARVENYVKHRPKYPAAVMEVLQEKGGMKASWVVADIGSGTGISCELFLRDGHEVYAVEPNADMRAAAEREHGSNPLFHSIAASGEATTLPSASADLIHCAQAFHWLDAARAGAEFRRIVRPGGAVAVVWNERQTDASPFLREYDAMLHEYGTDYANVAHKTTTAKDLGSHLGLPVHRHVVPNSQLFDFDALFGRVMSSSYVPLPSSPKHASLVEALRSLFDYHARGGRVEFVYSTEVFLASVPPAGT
jgi:SAM-dependent methyltransferase